MSFGYSLVDVPRLVGCRCTFTGWDGFNMIMDYIPSVVWFLGKAFFISFIIIWFKWSFPRVRIDQLLALEWKYLMPIGLFNLVLMTLLVVYGLHF